MITSELKIHYNLLTKTSPLWTQHVMKNMDEFLIDHAACERKASSMAMSMLTHYPDKKDLVVAMTDLALEELSHFRQVMQFINQRNLIITPDEKDPYINGLFKHVSNGKEQYFLDRLLLASIIERRGAERFLLVSEALPESKLKNFYRAIAKSEDKHYQIFLELSRIYFSDDQIDDRLQKLLVFEAKIVDGLTIRARLH